MACITKNRIPTLAWGLCLCACATQPPRTLHTPAAVEKPRLGVDGHPLKPREITEQETFSDLVAQAEQLERDRLDDSSAGCLFAAGNSKPSTLRFEANVHAALRPLPMPPSRLSTQLAAAKGRVRVLTHWGQVGTEAADLTIATFTGISRPFDGHAVAIFLTAAGVHLRSTEGEVAAPHAGPFPSTSSPPICMLSDPTPCAKSWSLPMPTWRWDSFKPSYTS